MGQEALNIGTNCLIRSSSTPTISTQSGDVNFQTNKVNCQFKIGCTNNQYITNHHNYHYHVPQAPTRESSIEYNEQGELILPEHIPLESLPNSRTTSTSTGPLKGRAKSPDS
eukprot:Pgem_evm1s12738